MARTGPLLVPLISTPARDERGDASCEADQAACCDRAAVFGVPVGLGAEELQGSELAEWRCGAVEPKLWAELTKGLQADTYSQNHTYSDDKT